MECDKEAFLCCPCHHKSDIFRKSDYFQCAKNDCIHNKKQHYFNSINGKPILITEFKCDSVISTKLIETPVVKRSKKRGLQSFIKRNIAGVSQVTLINCNKYIKYIEEKTKTRKLKVLVVGSGEKGTGTENLYDRDNIEIIGIDIYDSDSVDYLVDAHYLPFKKESFDGVWIQAVLEHVVEPHIVVSEIRRVLKGNGLVYAETPFMQQVHEGAYDFTRFTVLGHRWLFKEFSLLELGGNKGVGVALCWSIKYFVWAVFRNKQVAKIAQAIFFIPLRIIEMIADKRSLFDSSSGVYFLGRKSESKITHKDLVKLYDGFQKISNI
jgi:SAM-dependent methyltransferase